MSPPLWAKVFDTEANGDQMPQLSTTEGDRWWLPFLKKENNSFYLYSDNCQKLEHHFEVLKASNQSESKLSFTCEATNQCKEELNCRTPAPNFLKKVNVGSLLDDYVVKNHLRVQDGVNCWNNVLLFHGEVKKERFVSAREFHAFVTDRQKCQQVTSENEIRYGTVVAIRDKNELKFDPQGGGELHGFFLVTEDLVFSKNGPNATYPYELQPIERIWATFSVPELCREFNVPESCRTYATYYNCKAED
ncbi:MAG: hypothetical protein KDD34_07650 [Bdellovibrionales bacterium]|nr:hypothetical protein [Bdellovibrionales bacterium]